MSSPTVAVTGDAVPSDRQVSIDVEVAEQSTSDHPARLRICFVNDAPSTREFLFGAVSPFGPLVSDSGDAETVHVVPAHGTAPNAGFYADVISDSPTDGCWQLAYRYDVIDRGILWLADPGETTLTTYAVLADPEGDDCLPPGEYRFETEWGERYVGDADENQEEVWEPWGFTLVLG